MTRLGCVVLILTIAVSVGCKKNQDATPPADANAPAIGPTDDKPDYPKLIVGKWEVTKAEEWTFPKGAWIVFTKDGKAKTTGVKEGVEIAVEGTYKVEKDTFTLALKHGDLDKRQTLTITKISDKEMTTKDKDGTFVEWEKK